MKQIALAPIAALFMLLGCESKHPSQKTVQTFESNYPEAKNLSWKNDDGNWEADYKLTGKSFTSLFEENGSLLQTKHKIDFEDAPKLVRNAFGDKYDIAEVNEVFEVEMPRKAYFEFVMQTQQDKYKVTYDADGKFFEKDRD